MKNKKILLVVFVSLIFIFEFTMQLYLARADSQTTDEGVHLSAGYTYLTKGDFRFNPEHPPLVKYLSAVPQLFANFNKPQDAQFYDKASDFFYDSWREAREYGENFLYSAGNNAERILLLSRLPMIFLTLALGFLIFYISSKFWGINGGILSLFLFVLEPLILANGHLVTTDIGISFGYLLAVLMLWKFLIKPTWKYLLLFALALGMAQLMKFTAIVLYPASILLLIYFSISSKEGFKSFANKFGQLMFAFIFSWLVIWAGYAFKTSAIPSAPTPHTLPFISSASSNKIFQAVKPVILPRDYIKGLSIVLGHTESGHDSFLLGEHSKTGWWYYFPVVFSAKTTIATLLIFLLSIVLIFKDRKNRQKSFFFMLALIIFMAFAMNSKANLGVRHIMPVYALLFVLSGVVGKYLPRFTLGKGVLFLLMAFLLFENVRAFPHYMSYFNQFYGGTYNGYKVATDSNYDWGQDIKRIKLYLSDKNLQPAEIEYSWNSNKALQYYQIPASIYDKENSSRRFLIVNATALNNPPFKALQTEPIYARITPSVFVYQLNK